MAIDALYPHGNTCVRLRERFGLAGPFLWVCFLAACKRNSPQGEFVYVTEESGMKELAGPILLEQGIPSLEDFFTYTGQLHATKKRRRNDVVTIVSRGWDEWQATIKRQLDAERMSRKRGVSTSDFSATNDRPLSDEKATDSDSDSDSDKKPLAAVAAINGEGQSKQRDLLWDAIVEELGTSPSTRTERGSWNKAVKDLREAGATAAEIRTRCSVYRSRWPGMSLTPSALTKHWGSLAGNPSELSPEERDRRWRAQLEERGVL